MFRLHFVATCFAFITLGTTAITAGSLASTRNGDVVEITDLQPFTHVAEIPVASQTSSIRIAGIKLVKVATKRRTVMNAISRGRSRAAPCSASAPQMNPLCRLIESHTRIEVSPWHLTNMEARTSISAYTFGPMKSAHDCANWWPVGKSVGLSLRSSLISPHQRSACKRSSSTRRSRPFAMETTSMAIGSIRIANVRTTLLTEELRCLPPISEWKSIPAHLATQRPPRPRLGRSEYHRKPGVRRCRASL
jgi:hypothetical protein